MKKIISVITTGILLLLINNVQAQTISDFRKMTAEQKTQIISDSLKTNLDLTQMQYKKVHEVVYDAVIKITTVMKSSDAGAERGKKIQAILGDSQIRLKAVLTADQDVELEAKKAKWINYYKRTVGKQPMLFNAPAQ